MRIANNPSNAEIVIALMLCAIMLLIVLTPCVYELTCLCRWLFG